MSGAAGLRIPAKADVFDLPLSDSLIKAVSEIKKQWSHFRPRES